MCVRAFDSLRFVETIWNYFWNQVLPYHHPHTASSAIGPPSQTAHHLLQARTHTCPHRSTVCLPTRWNRQVSICTCACLFCSACSIPTAVSQWGAGTLSWYFMRKHLFMAVGLQCIIQKTCFMKWCFVNKNISHFFHHFRCITQPLSGKVWQFKRSTQKYTLEPKLFVDIQATTTIRSSDW